jgi:hypothetical protein
VEKAARRLTLLDADGRPLRVFTGLQLGPHPVGPKHFEGDGRTPEGHYTIDRGNPRSAYHLSLHISYPDASDRAYAAAAGRAPGGEIFLHGQPTPLARCARRRLDRRLHCAHQLRNRGNLAAGWRWNAHRYRALRRNGPATLLQNRGIWR